MVNQYSKPAYGDVRAALVEQWWKYKNCVGSQCRVPLPETLQATVTQETQWTVGYWKTINRIYGWPAG
jgi:hypothetical protein